jgi:hypothetical protein
MGSDNKVWIDEGAPRRSAHRLTKSAATATCWIRVEVIEFVGGEHTPRNLMIRAVKTDAKPDQLDIDRYLEITAQWGITPVLEKKLSTLNIR